MEGLSTDQLVVRGRTGFSKHEFVGRARDNWVLESHQTIGGETRNSAFGKQM